MQDNKLKETSPENATSKINIAPELKKFSSSAVDQLSATRKFKINALASQDLQALYEVSKAVNSTLILDDILGIVMIKSVELLKAERGFLMLLDSENKLQFKTAHNINKKQLTNKDLQVSTTVANSVLESGRSIYTSDALNDDRFAKKKSVLELNIRSAVCVPLRIKEQIIGILYLDNSSETNIFLKSDLHLFELFADLAALAIQNAQFYSDLSSHQRFQKAILDNTPVGIMVLNEDGILRSYNGAASEILGKSYNFPEGDRQDNDQLNFIELLPSSEKAFWRENIKKSKNEAIEIRSHSIKSGQNNDIILRIHFSPFTRTGEESDQRIIIIEDITQRTLIEQYLVVSEKMVAKGEMAAAIGHELNNYLSTLMSSAQLLPRYIKSERYEKVSEKVDAIVDSIDRMKRFTTGLMDFSALETSKSMNELRPITDDVVFFVKPQQRFRNINLKIDISPYLPKLMIDASQIHQVLLNLLMNAADAINSQKSDDGKITISADVDEKEITLIVTDNGPGIPEVMFSRLFEPHFTSKEKGHGLGLTTCKQIIEGHGGRITAHNNPDKGANIKIVLPLR
jgi:two-component system NtrC family sensor kinase